MLILPVGIGKKVPYFPILTVAITFCSVVLSIHHFKTISDIQNSTELKAMAQSTTKLIEEYCPKYGLDAEPCLRVKQLVDKKKDKSGQLFTVGEDWKGVVKYLTWINGQIKNPTDDDFTQFLPYQEYLKERETVKVWMSQDHAEILSPYSINLKSLLLAQFIHGSWLHLIGNFIVFVAFGIILEQRLNGALFLLVYFLGGTLGLLAHILFFADSSMVLLIGASADISAIMGAMFVLFYKSKMKFLASLIVWNKIFIWPIRVMVPLLYVAADISGFLGGTSNVAHGAHLVGFAVGALLGLIVVKLSPLESDYIYPLEKTLCEDLKNITGTQQKLEAANNILAYNPENILAVEEVCSSAFKDAQDKRFPNPEVSSFLKGHLQKFMVACWYSPLWHKKLLDLVEMIPPCFNAFSYLEKLNQGVLLSLSTVFIEQKKYFPAVRLYDQYLYNFPKSQQKGAILSNLSQIFDLLVDSEEFRSQIQSYYDYNKASSQIAELISTYAMAGEHNVKRAA